VSFNEYLRRSNATPSVKLKIQQAFQELKDLGINKHSALTKSMRHDFTRLKSFIKTENLNYRTPYGVKDKAPRMIMGSDPRFLALVGPWMMALADHIKTRLDGSQGILFTSGVTAKEASEYIGSEEGFINEETDVAHWDRSVHRTLRQFEFSLYKMFQPPVAVRQLLSADAQRTRGITASGVQYIMLVMNPLTGKLEYAAQRPSGRPDTSMGNSLLNALIRLFGFATRWGVDVATVCRMVRIIVQGDDGASRSPCSMPKVDWMQVFASVGFELEYRVVISPTLLTFCSMYNYPVRGGTCFGPKPGRVFAKTCYLLNPTDNLDPIAIVRGIALGFSVAASFIEPLKMWCDRILFLTEGHRHVQFITEEWQMTLSSAIPDASTAEFLFSRYGWTQTLRDAFAAELEGMQLGGGVGGPVYDHIIECDTDGPTPIQLNIL